MFWRNEKGFTGLEAAIVLIAFVTVAAVFSYILLGAGFFATQKGQEVVHTGVKQATSSLELAGEIIGKGNTDEGAYNLTELVFTLKLASGGTAIDLGNTLIVVSVPSKGIVKELKYADNTTAGYYKVDWIVTVNKEGADKYLQEFEKAQITINMTNQSIDLKPNTEFLVEIRPPVGATYPISLRVPPAIQTVMTLI
ncbi:MAG: archaellin/type IV pilin N-terminal domain-containing protein [Archaeoglobaceae archaeon]|nr:flagellin [Archaeoglobales archaeon]